MLEVVESKHGQVKYFFPAAAVLLFYTKAWYFPKIYNLTTLYGPIASGASVDPTPHRVFRLPCWYYRLYEIEKYNFRVDSNSITSIFDLIQIRPAVHELNHADGKTERHDLPYMCSFHAHHEKNTQPNIS
jgi:hypothetical protein